MVSEMRRCFFCCCVEDYVLSIGVVLEFGKGERVRWRTARKVVGPNLSIFDDPVQVFVEKRLSRSENGASG